MTTLTQPLMADRELAVLEVFIWFALVFFTILAAAAAWRRFIRDGDVVAKANLICDEYESIETYLENWMPGLSTKTAIAETRALDGDRA